MDTGIIRDSFQAVNYYLDKRQKRNSLIMFFLIFSSSLVDIFGLAAVVPVMLAASDSGYISSNKYFKYVYDYFGFTNERNFLIFTIVLVLLVFIIKTLYLVVVNYKQASFIADIGLKTATRQFDKYINIPYLEFVKIGTGTVINQVLIIPNQFSANIVRQLLTLSTEVLNILLILGALLLYKPVLVLLISCILGPGSYLMYTSIRKKAQAIGKEINDKRPVANTLISDTFVGYIDMRLAGKQDYFREKLTSNQRSIQELAEQSYLYSLLPGRGIEVLAMFGIVFIFLYSLFSTERASIIAIVGAFAASAYRLMPTINRLLQALLNLKNNHYVLDNLKLFREYEQRSSKVKQEPILFKKDIKIEHLKFSFPESDRPVLKEINLEIKKGERIGFIGSSGSGKSTLMSIILRFYQEQSGCVLIDGKLLEDKHINSWHSQIGYVKQDVFIMNATVKDNITLGETYVDEERLCKAIEISALSDVIGKLPEGIETVLRERGSNLSGGQRQRIGIARALYKDAEILILDEATSALDNHTEQEVSEAIDNLAQTDITILIVAHRITTLKGCDRIYKLDNGMIGGVYTYEEILHEVI